MQNASHQKYQCLNQRDFWSSPIVSTSTPYAIAILTAILGTTVTLTLTYEDPSVSASAASTDTAIQPPSAQPPALDNYKDILSQLKQPIPQENPQAFDPTRPVLEKAIAPLAFNPLDQAKQQAFLGLPSWQQGNSEMLGNAALFQSPQQQHNNTPSLETSSQLALLLDTTVALAQRLNDAPLAERNAPTQLREEQAVKPGVETSSEPNPQLASELHSVELMVEDVVALAVENNTDTKSAYLKQIAQRPSSDVTQERTVPNSTSPVSVSWTAWGANGVVAETDSLTEQGKYQALKSMLTARITDAILGYRELLRAQKRVKLEERSLELAQQLLEANQRLVAVGQLSSTELVPSKVAVANRQLSLLTAQTNLVAAKLELLDLLGIDQDINIVSAETPVADPTALDANHLRQLVLENLPHDQQPQLQPELSEFELSRVGDNSQPDQNLIASLNNAEPTTSDVNTGLGVIPESRNLTKEERIERSLVNLPNSESSLETSTDSLEIQVSEQVRDVQLSFAQVEQARQTVISFEQQLEIEREKQGLGQGSRISEFVKRQNDLAHAKNSELDATINYLNALTRLDQSLGTTLDTWQVKIEKE